MPRPKPHHPSPQQTPPHIAFLLTTITLAACSQNPGTPQAGNRGSLQALANASFYVDCSATSTGNGTQASPWNTLTAANTPTFGAGDKLLFKRGTTCVGTLKTKGSGGPGNPFIIDAYGTGARPIIDGNGATDAVKVYNQQYIELRNLEVKNDAATAARRRGVYVVLENFGTGTYYRLTNLYVHNVKGDSMKDVDGSAGIQLDVLGTTPGKYDDVILDGNQIATVDRSGINMSTNFWCRAQVSDCAGKAAYVPWTNVIVQNNTVSNTGGDGIVLQYTEGGLARNNVVSMAAQKSYGANAGLWAWNADGVTFDSNEVYATARLPDNSDGQGLDVDFGQDGTVFQYNYSHDNAGGFILYCGCGPAGSTSTNSVVRYNVSQNDAGRTVQVYGGSGHQFYNNTIYLPNSGTPVLSEGTPAQVTFSNNIFYTSGTLTFTVPSGFSNYPFDHNVFYGTPQGLQPADAFKVTANPLFVSAGSGGTGLGSVGGYQLQGGSPARSAGRVIGNNGGRDYFGNAVPASCAPDIGAHQASSAGACAGAVAIANAGFEANGGDSQTPTGWGEWAGMAGTGADASYVEANVPHSGTYVLTHWKNVAYEVSTTQTVTGLNAGTYIASVWTRSSGGQTAAQVVVKSGGTTLGVASIPTGNAWTQVSVPVTLSGTSVSIELYSNAQAGQWVTFDDVTLIKATPVTVANAGFEANGGYSQTPTAWGEWAGTAGTGADASYVEANTPHSGTYVLTHWKNAAYEVSTTQTVNSLSAGAYLVTAWTRSSGGQTTAQLVVKAGSTTLGTANIPAGIGWTQVSVPVTLSSTSLSIELYSQAAAGQYINFDDVSIVRLN